MPDIPERSRTDPVDLVLTWETASPANVRLLLGAVGFEPVAAGSGGTFAIPGLRLKVTGSSGPDRLGWTDAAGRRAGATAGVVGGGRGWDAAGSRVDAQAGASVRARLLAVAVAAVDLERAAAVFDGAARDLSDDVLLGARVATTGVAGVVVAEPATEGRLAATLARHGEGPAAVYVAVAPAAFEELRARLIQLGGQPRDGAGPFGPQVLARARPAWGPHLLLVAGAPGPGILGAGGSATITP